MNNLRDMIDSSIASRRGVSVSTRDGLSLTVHTTGDDYRTARFYLNGQQVAMQTAQANFDFITAHRSAHYNFKTAA